MSKYNKDYYVELSKQTGFQRAILEKIHRLTVILEFINKQPILSENLVLKGGTALNLVVFNLPRLSVDLDFDLSVNYKKDDMLEVRTKINELLEKYLILEGYEISKKSKETHSLDSMVISYINTDGNNDLIKIETNYSLREHILPVKKSKILTDMFEIEGITTLDYIELFATKITALLNRTTARDLYDIYNIARFELVDESDYNIFKFDENESKYINEFNNRKIDLNLLFEDKEMVNKLKDHPMILWKNKEGLV